MDETLKQALTFSTYKQTLALQRTVLKDKLHASLIYACYGGLFKIDRELLVFVKMLIDDGRSSNVPLLDVNQNPILIPDLQQFYDEIFDRYFTSMTVYFNEYEKLKQSRSTEKLVDL